MKHTIFPLSFAIITLFCLGACGKKEEKKEKVVPTVEVSKPVQSPVTLYKELPGTVQADSKVDVVCRVNGKLTGIYVKPGQKVSKGQVLYTVEPTLYRDAVTKASAALATARSQHEYAISHAEALKKAYEKDAVAKMTVLEAEAAAKSSAADIRDAEAALNDARTQLGYCTVTAPISGTISDTPYSVGAYLNGEAMAVTMSTIYDNSDLKVVFGIEESEYRLLPEKDDSIYRSIPLKFREQQMAPYTADLYYKAPSVDASTGLMTLQGRINSPGKELRDGMYCSISLPTGYDDAAILVRDASIGTDQLGKYLYVLSPDDKIVKRHIKTGQIWQDSLRIVDGGISLGDRYVTSAMLTVREGEKIKPVMRN